MPARGSSWRTSPSGSPRATRSVWWAQRRRQDHPHQDPRRRGAARLRPGAPHRRGRLPAAGPAHRRPRGARPRPDPVRARPRRRRTPLREAEAEMGSDDPQVRDRAMKRYTRADAELHAGGGYAAESEAAQIAAASASRTGSSAQPLKTLSGGQRRRVELARILFSGAETLLLDEPTNHLDADSIVWLRDFLKAHKGGPDRDQPRQRAARGDRQQGAPPRRQPGRDRRLQHGLEGLPHAARDRRAAPQAGAGQRREQGQDAHRPGQQDARQGHQGHRPRSRCSSAPRR